MPTPTEDIIVTFLKNNEWLGIVIYIAVRELWPFLRDRWWPQRVKQINAEQERIKKLEERQVKAEELNTATLVKMTDAVQTMATFIATNNERLAQLIVSHSEHTRFMTEAVTEMRLAVNPKVPRERRKLN